MTKYDFENQRKMWSTANTSYNGVFYYAPSGYIFLERWGNTFEIQKMDTSGNIIWNSPINNIVQGILEVPSKNLVYTYYKIDDTTSAITLLKSSTGKYVTTYIINNKISDIKGIYFHNNKGYVLTFTYRSSIYPHYYYEIYDFNPIVPNDNDTIKSYVLSQNYPNPFNPSTRIKYQVSVSSPVKIDVYDVLGNLIKTVVNERKPAGIYEEEINLSAYSSGVYFYRIQAGNFVQTKKMMLMK